jgi:hypothetical protein
MRRRDIVVPGGMPSIDAVGEMAERAETLGYNRISGSVAANEVAQRRFVTRVAVFEPWLFAVGRGAAVAIGLLSVPYLLFVARRTTSEVDFQ